jgi:hypothetical protein
MRHRLSRSLTATGVAWLVSGIVFTLVTKGPGSVSAWLIWGTVVFMAGWMLVGLTLVALGDRVLRMSAVSLTMAAGAGGTLVIELPYIIVRVLTPKAHYVWSVRDLVWPGLAFAIAASAAWLYRMLLRSSRTALLEHSPARARGRR